MDEETEVLDWGHDEDEQAGHGWRDPEDAEDAVSLGGDEDDMQGFYSYQSTGQDAPEGTAAAQKSMSQQQSKRDHQRESSSQKPPNSQPTSQSQGSIQGSGSPQLQRTQSIGKLTHALPPKPVVTVTPFVHPSPAQTSTLASSMVQRERRSNGHGKPTSSNGGDLPPDWEIRHPRGGGHEHYYYNVKTHESTWTRPGLVSGRSSPSKDRENGAVSASESRSPGYRKPDIVARADSIERRATVLSTHREAKRRASPGGKLSYEDRHYRPGGTKTTSATIESSDRQDERGSSTQSPRPDGFYPAPRSPSPRMIPERRPERSPSPVPRQDYPVQDRAVRSRRNVTPPRTQADHGTWKEHQRDFRDIAHPRQAGVPDRTWGSSRDTVPAEPILGQMHEERPRGRPQRTHIDSSSQFIPPPRDQAVRHEPSEWPASSHRSSPPHLHEVTPATVPRNPRGTAQFPSTAPAMASERQSRFHRPANSSMSSSTHGARHDVDHYESADSVPQRRGRGDSPDHRLDPETKRRRVGDILDRQPSIADLGTVPGLPPKPVAHPFSSPTTQNDLSRPRKRPPLPPQAARFREAATRPPPPESLPPASHVTDYGRGRFAEPSPRRIEDVDMPPKFTDRSSDMSVVPQRQPPLLTPRGPDISESVITSPLPRAGSRQDLPPPAQPRDYSMHRERDNMMVDRPSYRVSSPRIQEGPARANSGMYADHLGAGVDVQVDAPPRGPRAMAAKASFPLSEASPHISPSTSLPSLRSMQPQEPLPPSSSRQMSRIPSQSNRVGWPERHRNEMSMTYSSGPTMTPDVPKRSFDANRNVPYDASGDRRGRRREETLELKQQERDPREPGSRYPRRPLDGPPLPLPLSGTNSVPIGARKGDIQQDPISPANHYRSSNDTDFPSRGHPDYVNEDTRNESDRERQKNPMQTTATLSPPNTYRPLAVDTDVATRRHSFSNASRRTEMMSEQSPNSPMDINSGPARPRKDSIHEQRERPPRATRFGPEPNQLQAPSAPASTEPRIWMTRQESQSLETRGRGTQQEDTSQRSFDTRLTKPGDSAWHHLPEPSDLSQRFNGAPSRGRHDPGSQPGMVEQNVWQRRQPNAIGPEYGRDRGSPITSRSRIPPQSLEGRLSSHYDDNYTEERYRSSEETSPSLPPRPHHMDVYVEQPSRPEYRGAREPPYRESASTGWDRSEEIGFRESSPNSSGRGHHERARLPPPPSSVQPPSEQDSPMRTSKPIRIRRPPPMSTKPPQDEFATSTSGRDASMRISAQEDHRGVDIVDAQSRHTDARPVMPGRGGSLLDRLSFDSPAPPSAETSSPSLRERVEVYSGGPDNEPAKLHPDAPMDVEYEGHGASGDSFRGIRGGKKRYIKPKRGRRGGLPP